MVINNYWLWESEISPTVCDLLLSEVDFSQVNKGAVGLSKDNSVVYHDSFRKADVVWQDCIKPFGCILYAHAQVANLSAGWNFEIVGPEHTQITIYYENSFHNWHVDSIPIKQTHTRKITNILFLSNPEEYQGGEFLLKSPSDSNSLSFKPPKGSIISFPSFVEHQVNKVTSGKRVTAVSWVNGPLFR